MIFGIGTDIESVSRFKKSCSSNRFLNLIFTEREIKYCKSKKKPYMSFAGKFCAKEAVLKAYSKNIPFKNIEIINEKTGKISVLINGKRKNIHCSISHTDDYAVAFAIKE